MKIIKKLNIKAPIETVWKIWAVDFDKAGDWMAFVNHSYETDPDEKLTDAPIAGRVCEFSTSEGGPIAMEDVTRFDADNYRLDISVIPKNFPAPIVQNLVSTKLTKINDHETLMDFEASIKLTTLGNLMAPVIKVGFGKQLGQMLEELKHYAETGNVHPRKQKKLNEQFVKA